MLTILLYVVAALTCAAAVRKAWRDATAADRAEGEYERFRQRANRHVSGRRP